MIDEVKIARLEKELKEVRASVVVLRNMCLLLADALKGVARAKDVTP